jgi:hypothetical protein
VRSDHGTRWSTETESRNIDIFLRTIASLSLVIFAGCASSAAQPDPRIKDLQEASQRIATTEQQCMDAAVKRANDDLSQITGTADAANRQRIQTIDAQRAQDLAQCKSAADHDNEALSTREQAEYERQARQENDEATILRLVGSPPP